MERQLIAGTVLVLRQDAEDWAYGTFHSYCNDVIEVNEKLIQLPTNDVYRFIEEFTRTFSDGSGACQKYQLLSIHCG